MSIRVPTNRWFIQVERHMANEKQAGGAERHAHAEEGVLEHADALGIGAVEAPDNGESVSHNL